MSEEQCAPKETATPEKGGELRLGLSLLLAALIGALFFALAIHAVPLGAVKEYLQQADWVRLLRASVVFAVLYGICHGARVVRWFYLVRPTGAVEKGEVRRVCTVGFTAILLLPFRLGEFVRPFLLARNTGISPAALLATVVVERVIDGLIITGLLFLALMTYRGDASIEFARAFGLLAAGIFIPALVLCVLAYLRRDLARRLVATTAGLISKKLGEKISTLLDQFVDGFEGLVKSRDLVPFLSLTVVYWSANVVSMWAFLHLGFGLEVSLWEMVAVLAILVIGIMLPAGPAMAGNFEYFMAQAFSLFVNLDDPFTAGQVGSFAALTHLLQILVIVLPGAWVMVRYRTLRLTRETIEASRRLEQ